MLINYTKKNIIINEKIKCYGRDILSICRTFQLYLKYKALQDFKSMNTYKLQCKFLKEKLNKYKFTEKQSAEVNRCVCAKTEDDKVQATE